MPEGEDKRRGLRPLLLRALFVRADRRANDNVEREALELSSYACRDGERP